jgi:exosortase/archaeosortase family protein
LTANVARVLAFLALFTALTLAWANPSAAPLQAWVIERLTVQPAAWLFGLIDAERGVEAAGARLTSPAGNVQVLPGCEGADLAFLLGSAMLFAPLAWRLRLLGLAVGAGLVFVLNQARVIALVLAAGHEIAGTFMKFLEAFVFRFKPLYSLCIPHLRSLTGGTSCWSMHLAAPD